jgi:hypothetical protein
MSKKLVPFSWMPGSWGLKGKTREIARAEYELKGFELEERLLTLRLDELEPDVYNRKCYDLHLKYNKITQEAYYRLLIDLIKDDKQKALAILELDLRDGKIKQLEYEKQTATLKGEPWVTVLTVDFNKKSSLEGSFELDWNTFFVEKLRSDGYVAPTEDLIVNMWFMEVCRNVALEEFDGTGDFTADSEANLDTVKRWGSESFPEGRKGYK